MAVAVDRERPSYDPRFCSAPLGDPVRQACIDSAAKVVASPFVVKDLQTNIFLNCPIVPAGTAVDPVPGGPGPNEPQVMEAFFEGRIVNFVPYDIEDGGFNPQILYMFKDAAGNVLSANGDPLHANGPCTPSVCAPLRRAWRASPGSRR
ncbi:MAG: hypothetical protein DMD91_29795 [Candidatus Rokuibacteriota bacterium]|nr:MAG: hypothetical protein DMD91_29795 [Candidatus Rokubacteria bacterium]